MIRISELMSIQKTATMPSISNPAATSYSQSEAMGNDSSKVNKFWTIAAKWNFLPLIYLLFAIILAVVFYFQDSARNKVEVTFLSFLSGVAIYYILNLIFMPAGLGVVFSLIFPKLLNAEGKFTTYALFLFPIGLIASVISIQYFKYEKNKILKWLIIMWIVLILLSFGGCVISGPFHD